jgi:hypothetical protein
LYLLLVGFVDVSCFEEDVGCAVSVDNFVNDFVDIGCLDVVSFVVIGSFVNEYSFVVSNFDEVFIIVVDNIFNVVAVDDFINVVEAFDVGDICSSSVESLDVVVDFVIDVGKLFFAVKKAIYRL